MWAIEFGKPSGPLLMTDAMMFVILVVPQSSSLSKRRADSGLGTMSGGKRTNAPRMRRASGLRDGSRRHSPM